MRDWMEVLSVYLSVVLDMAEARPVLQISVGMARCYFSLKEYDGSIYVTEKAISIGPRVNEVRNNKFLSQKAAGNFTRIPYKFAV